MQRNTEDESSSKPGSGSPSKIQPGTGRESDPSSPSHGLTKRHVIATKETGKLKSKGKKSSSKPDKEGKGGKKTPSFKVSNILKKRSSGSVGVDDVIENQEKSENLKTKEKVKDDHKEEATGGKGESSGSVVDLTQIPSTQSKETTSGQEPSGDKSGKNKSSKSSKDLGKTKDKKETPTPKTTKKERAKGPKKVQVKSHVLTDYFPVRRSSRKPKSVLQKEQDELLIENIKLKKEEGLEVVEFEKKGRGVVAKRAFRKGSFIVEYAGELVDWAEAKRREEEYAKDSSIGCYMYYFVFNDINYCVDATSESGRLGRLLNHSRKSPNCKTRLIGVEDEAGGGVVPRLVIIAKQDISAGEELTYDYGDKNKETLQSHPWLKST